MSKDKLFDEKERLDLDAAVRSLLNQGEYLYEALTETYFAYNGRYYMPTHEIAFEKTISNLFGSSLNELGIKNLMKKFSRNIGVANLLSEQQPKDQINLLNGILDLSNKTEVKLLPHNSDTIFFNCVSANYDPAAKCPEWLKFLNKITQENQKVISLIQEMFGYCLTPGNWMQAAFILMGDGNNGKSTLLEILRELLGPDSTSALSLNELDQKFKRSMLRGKLANISDEAPTGKEISSDIFKNLVSGGTITAEEKNKPPFTFQNMAKIITAANKPPVLREQTTALHRRLVVIPFEYRITKSERNPHMVAALKRELSGILNWAIEGYHRLKECQAFTECITADDAKMKFIKDSDSVLMFVDECCEKKSSAKVSSIIFYKAYKEYCIERGYHPCADNEFGKRLKLHIKNLNKVRRSNAAREWAYQGIKLTDEAEGRYCEYRPGSRH